MQPRILEVRTKILKKNDELARDLRTRFADQGVYVINVVSSPGAGKTELLTALMRELREQGVRVAAVVGDLATENDAVRLEQSGCKAHQILTGTMCHLEADMVENALEDFALAELDVVLIENVGNIVCPQSWDLGEDLRMLCFPSTEGEDKPLKYPTLINTCDLVALTKMDLAEIVEFDTELATRNCDEARPGVPVLRTSGKTGAGIPELARFIRDRAWSKAQVESRLGARSA